MPPSTVFTPAQIAIFGTTKNLLHEALLQLMLNNNVAISNFPARQNVFLDTPILLAGKTAFGVEKIITLPAVVGKTHLITAINIATCANAAVAGLTTLRSITSTNLGGLELAINTVRQIGVTQHLPNPASRYGIKATLANTVTTLILPAIPNLLYVYNITYILI